MYFILHKDSDFVCKNGILCTFFLEVHLQAHIELSTGKVVRHGILDAVHIGYPIVAAHVAYVKQVEHVKPEPNALEMAESGKIEDAKTLVLIYKAARRFGI